MSLALDPPVSLARKGMRIAVLEGCFSAVQGAYNGGVFLTGLALFLGADAWTLGLLAAVPALSQFAQMLAAWILARYGHRKPLTIWGASIGRYLWLVIACIPFMPIAGSVRLGLMITIQALASVLGQMSGVAWCDWMADMVPGHERGRYFGRRNAINAVAGMLAIFMGTRALDGFKAHGQVAWGFFWLLVVAGVASLGSQVALSLQPEMPMRPKAEETVRAPFRAVLRDRPFLLLCAMMIVWTFVVGLTAPFNYAYALERFHLSYGTLGLHTMILTALGILAQPLWGRIIDRRGSRYVLVTTLGLTCLTPLLWAALRDGFLAPLWLDAAFMGLFWPGIGLATFNLLIELSTPDTRAAYVGVYNAGMGLANCLAALAGGGLLSILHGAQWQLMGVPLVAMQGVFLVAALLRLLTAWIVRSLPGATLQPDAVVALGPIPASSHQL